VLAALHGVFLVYLLVALAWNASVCGAAVASRERWERWAVLPLQIALVGVLLVDRARPHAPPLLAWPWVAGLFPLACALALAQNVHAILERGARLTDIPILLANVGLLLCSALGAAELAGAALPPGAAALLHDHALLQHLLGNRLALWSSLSWHVPLLVRRDDARSVPGLLAGVFMAAVAGFLAVMLAAFLGTARAALDTFAAEPRVAALRADLRVAVLRDSRAWDGPGQLEALRLPADTPAPGTGPWPSRPLLLELDAPDAWRLHLPVPDAAAAQMLDGAQALADAWQPDWLLPFPDPDGRGALLLGVRSPAGWRALFDLAAERVARVSPRTRLAVRLAETGERSHALLLALAADPAVVAVAGPRLLPGPAAAGGPALADATLDTWERWLAPLQAPPELWILAAGCSAPAYGEVAQARYVEGCLARANGRQAVKAVILDAWSDAGHTLGLHRAGGAPRLAGRRVLELLAAPRTEADR